MQASFSALAAVLALEVTVVLPTSAEEDSKIPAILNVRIAAYGYRIDLGVVP